jgi:putative peptide zinc metalloprotease protein
VLGALRYFLLMQIESALQNYSITGGWEITGMASDPRCLLISGNGRYFQLSGLAAKIVSAVSATPKTSNELLDELQSQAQREGVSHDRVRDCLQKLVNHGIVSDGRSSRGSGETKNGSKWFGHRYFAVRLPLLSPQILLPVTCRLAGAYSPFWIAVLCPSLIFVHICIWLFIYFHHSAIAILEWPHGWALAAIIFGNYAGLLLHELGHASACVRCNVQHGPIGVGIYLVFPAFYTDVSEAWKLSRSQRMAVDAAGIYTSLLLSTCSFILYATTHVSVFLMLATLYDLSVLMNLNPFIRMDCYWLLSDALNISNLMARNKEMTAWMLRRLVGLPAARPALLKTEPKLRAGLLVYYAGSVIFAAALIGRLLTIYMPNYLSAMPSSLASLKLAVQLYGLSFEAAAKAFKIVVSSVPLVGMLAYIARSVAKVFQLMAGGTQ